MRYVAEKQRAAASPSTMAVRLLNCGSQRGWQVTPLPPRWPEGQISKMSCSKRVPGFGIVRRCRMVSLQEGHTRIGALCGTNGEHSKAGIEGE